MRVLAALVLLISLALPAYASGVQQLLANPSFASGAFSGWTLSSVGGLCESNYGISNTDRSIFMGSTATDSDGDGWQAGAPALQTSNLTLNGGSCSVTISQTFTATSAQFNFVSLTMAITAVNINETNSPCFTAGNSSNGTWNVLVNLNGKTFSFAPTSSGEQFSLPWTTFSKFLGQNSQPAGLLNNGSNTIAITITDTSSFAQTYKPKFDLCSGGYWTGGSVYIDNLQLNALLINGSNNFFGGW